MSNMLAMFDFVVVGGGSAGAAIAARRPEDPDLPLGADRGLRAPARDIIGSDRLWRPAIEP